METAAATTMARRRGQPGGNSRSEAPAGHLCELEAELLSSVEATHFLSPSTFSVSFDS